MPHPAGELRFDVTVDPGLEDIAAAEVRERFAAVGAGVEVETSPRELPGHLEVITGGEPDEAAAILRRLHSAYYLTRLYESVALSPRDAAGAIGDGAAAAGDAGGRGDGAAAEAILEPVYRRLESLAIPELEGAKSFCVRTRRVGTHPFSSPEVERRAGAVLWRRFGTKVDLTSPECTIRVDITNATARIGVLYSSESLNKRFPWVWRPRVTLRNTIAYSMLRLGGYLELPAGATLLDPFCGSGTILVEAASLREDISLRGSDRDETAIIGATKNAAATGFAERISFECANALDIDHVYAAATVSLIVTNPPFGVRLAK